MSKRNGLGLMVMVFWGVVATPVFAQEQSGVSTMEPHIFAPIVVTANKREQNIQEIPGSVSAMNSQQIEDYRIEKSEDIFKATPNIYMFKTGPSASASTFASMRGIVASMGGSPVLGLYVDDVYYPNLDITLLDAERVEVLRGPQGSLYGRNTEAGVINVITKQPTNNWEKKLGAEYGSYNMRNFTGSFSGPLIEDSLLFRASGSYRASDNYFKNKYDGDDSVNRYEDKDFRAKLMTSTDEKLKMALTFDFQDYWSGGYADFAPMRSANPRKNINVDFPGSAWKKSYGASLKTEYDFDSASLLSITSFRKETVMNINDIDFTPVDIYRMKTHSDNMSYNQEFRLKSTDESSPLQWLAGAYGFYEQEKHNYKMRMNFDSMGNPFGMHGLGHSKNIGDIDSTGIAFFTQSSYTLWDRLELTAGLRYDHLHRSIDYSADMGVMGPGVKGSASKDFEAWMPKFGASYKLTDNIQPYASVSKGYKQGGFNIVNNIGHSFKSEYTWNYELGTKTQWLDNRLIFNVAAFYIDWKDRQVEILAPGGNAWHMDNAGKAESKGFEVELTAKPLDGLEVIGSLGFTHAKYTDYSPAPGVDYSGKRVIDSPRYTARLGATYHFDNGIFLGATYNRYGKIYYDLNNYVYQGSYDLVDVKIGYEKDHFEVYAWANNIFNEKYFTRVAPAAATGIWHGRQGEPQTFGVSASILF